MVNLTPVCGAELVPTVANACPIPHSSSMFPLASKSKGFVANALSNLPGTRILPAGHSPACNPDVSQNASADAVAATNAIAARAAMAARPSIFIGLTLLSPFLRPFSLEACTALQLTCRWRWLSAPPDSYTTVKHDWSKIIEFVLTQAPPVRAHRTARDLAGAEDGCR